MKNSSARDAPLNGMYDLRVPDMELTPTGLGIYSFCMLSFFTSLASYKRRAKPRCDTGYC